MRRDSPARARAQRHVAAPDVQVHAVTPAQRRDEQRQTGEDAEHDREPHGRVEPDRHAADEQAGDRGGHDRDDHHRTAEHHSATATRVERVVRLLGTDDVVVRRCQEVALDSRVEIDVGAPQPVHRNDVHEVLGRRVVHPREGDQPEERQQEQHPEGRDAEPPAEPRDVAEHPQRQQPGRHQGDEDRDAGEHLALGGAA